MVGSNMDKIYIVMDYVEHDMKGLMETMKDPFMIGMDLYSDILLVQLWTVAMSTTNNSNYILTII